MEKTKKLTLGRRLGYASGDMLGGGAFALIGVLFLKYLVSVVGIPAGIAGGIVMSGKIWDAISDPLMGIISDKTRSRFGRKRVWFLVGIIPVFVSFAMLWTNFGISSTGAKVAYYAFAYILFSTAFTIVMVPYNALLPDMVEGYTDRVGFTNTRSLISAVAGISAVIVPPILIANGISYATMGIIFGLVFSLPLIITFLTTWENSATVNNQMNMLDMLKQFKNSFKNRTYRQYLGIFIFGQFSTDVLSTLLMFWIVDVLAKASSASMFTTVMSIASLGMLLVNMVIAQKKGKHIPSIICLPLAIVGIIAAFFFGPNTSIAVVLAVFAFVAVGASPNGFVPWALLPDIPDSDEMITGTKNPGIYAGMATFIRKFSSGVGIFLVGLLIDAFGYVESQAGEVVVQSAGAIMGIKILFTVLPLVLYVATFLFAKNYKLTKQNHATMLQAVNFKKENNQPIEDPDVIKVCEDISGIKFEDMWVGRKDA